MAFVDNLAFLLFAISFVGFLFVYLALSSYLSYRRNRKGYREHVKSASVPLLFLGAYMTIMGIWGQIVWPLPGSYNLLFYDPLTGFGLVLLAFFASSHFKIKMEYAGFFALMNGIALIIYGVNGYMLKMTSSPIALLGMYALYGIAGISSYPLMLALDEVDQPKNKFSMKVMLFLIIFSASIFVASAIAAFIGVLSVPAHLANPP